VAASARIVLHADVTGQVGATALLAAGSGAVLLARSHPHDQAPGGLATLLSPDTEFLPFRLASEAVRRVRELLARPDFRQGIAAAAIRRCRAEHRPGSRLRLLLQPQKLP
jgi:hypothetical protein